MFGLQCLNCRRVGALNPQLFSQSPNTLSNYVQRGQLYTVYTYNLGYITILFGL